MCYVLLKTFVDNKKFNPQSFSEYNFRLLHLKVKD